MSVQMTPDDLSSLISSFFYLCYSGSVDLGDARILVTIV